MLNLSVSLRSTRPGCGTQHPLRIARVLLAAAPATTPCFRHWRWSSLLHYICKWLDEQFKAGKH